MIIPQSISATNLLNIHSLLTLTSTYTDLLLILHHIILSSPVQPAYLAVAVMVLQQATEDTKTSFDCFPATKPLSNMLRSTIHAVTVLLVLVLNAEFIVMYNIVYRETSQKVYEV